MTKAAPEKKSATTDSKTKANAQARPGRAISDPTWPMPMVVAIPMLMALRSISGQIAIANGPALNTGTAQIQ